MMGNLGLLYSAMIALYRLKKDSNLYPEIISLLKDEDSLKMFFLLFGGKQINVPTLEEFYKVLKATYYAYLKHVEKWSDDRILQKEGFSESELDELRTLAREAKLHDELIIRNPFATNT